MVDTDEFYGNDAAAGDVDALYTALVFKTYCSLSPTLVTPNLGTPTAGTIDMANVTITGTAAEFNTAVSDDTIAFISDNLSVFAATTSLQLLGVISDETGSGLLVFGTSPTLVTPALGTPSALVLTNATALPVGGIADGTDGELITWGTDGTTETVGVGTVGQVLTSVGAGNPPTFQAAAGGGHVIEDEGTPLTARSKLNFVGAIVAATDDSGDDASDVTVAGTAANFNTACSDDTFAFISDNLSVFAATTSAQLLGVISDETGTGLLVFGTSPTIVTPTIASMTNAQHGHTDAAGGGTITEASISDLQSYLLNIVEDTTPQLGADLDANGFDINLDLNFRLSFNSTVQSLRISGDSGGLNYVVPNGDTHDSTVDATIVQSIAETGITVTGTLDVSGIIDAPDIELGTFSARDGSLAGTIADSTGVVTFAAKPVFDVALTILGTVATGTWEGDVVASAFLDADTAHLTTNQTFTGVKTFGAAADVGKLVVAGNTSGTTTIAATAIAGTTTATLQAVTGTLALLGDTLDAFAATTSAELASVISDETGSGLLVFGTSPTFITPVLGTPSSGNLGSCTVIPMAQASGILPDANMPNLTGDVTTVEGAVATTIADNAVTLAMMAGGTDGNLITYDASGDPAFVATGTAAQVLTSNGVGTAPTFQAAAGGAVTWTDVIPCTLEVSQGTVAYPFIHSLVTQVSKIDGFVLPTATDSTINFKWVCPVDLAGTPALVIRVHTVTLSANTTDAINLTLSQRFITDAENADQAFVTNDGVAAANYNVSDTIESYDFHDMTPVNSPVAGDICTGQIFRDISADAAGDVIIVGIEAHIDRTAS